MLTHSFKHGGEPVFQNAADYLILLLLIPIIALARSACERTGAKIFISSEAAQKLAKNKGSLRLTLRKFEESFWKCAYYSCSALYGILFISWEPFVRNPFDRYPNEIPSKVYWFYMVSMAFYIWMTICLVWDVRKKDFYQMTAHHCITLTLMTFSYTCSLTNMGCIVLLLHDIADPFLELAKMCQYTRQYITGHASFGIFGILFVGSRMAVYPVLSVYPTLTQTWGLAVDLKHEEVYYVLNVSLVGLLILDALWSALIIRIFVRRVVTGTLKDERSDDEQE